MASNPSSTTIKDFKPPSVSRLRYRPAAHLIDLKSDYFAKFTKAIELMKALPDDDPRSFTRQANLYSAYRNGDYDQLGFPDGYPKPEADSSKFLPFHRAYLYFFERILAKLIDDPDFPIPFWNWDSPDGMTIPSIYVDPTSSLQDAKLEGKLVDLDYSDTEETSTKGDLVKSNLSIMYRQMVSNKTASLFHGAVYKDGDKLSPSMGAIENLHTTISLWIEDQIKPQNEEVGNFFSASRVSFDASRVNRLKRSGDQSDPFKEDMGNFYSSGRDAMFYGHHANVDRMWDVWTKALSHRNFNDADWLNAAFYFYDENKSLVRTKVSDFLDTESLGYGYQSVDILWLETKPSPKKFANKGGIRLIHQRHVGQARAEKNAFPIVLDKSVTIEIPRPKKSRTKLDKEGEEEVLVLENIQVDSNARAKFDVYIKDEDDETPTGPENSEFAGSFTNPPHYHKNGNKLETNLILPLSDLLEDLDIEGDEKIKVTLLPKKVNSRVKIGGIGISYLNIS